MKSAPDQNAIESAIAVTACANNISPQFPPHGTQTARLLAVVLTGEKVNPLYGWKRLGIY